MPSPTLPFVDRLESRRLLASIRFEALDPSFGGGGVVAAAAYGGEFQADSVAPLADGGSIVGTGEHVYRRYDARGRLVNGWADHGTLDLGAGNGSHGDAVDPRTGRLVLAAYRGPTNSLDVYGADGKLERSLRGHAFGSLDISQLDAMTFDHSGRLLMAEADRQLVGRWLPATGVYDHTFGGDGLVTLGAAAGNAYSYADGLIVGPGDTVTVVRESYGDQPNAYKDFLDVDHFDVHGKHVAMFGDGGHARVVVGDQAATNANPYETRIADVAAAPDGSIYLLQTYRETDTYTDHYQLRQIRDDGTFAAPIDLRLDGITQYLDDPVKLLVDAAGGLDVVGPRGVVRLDARRRFDDAGFNGTPGMALFTSRLSEVHDATIDTSGRLLVLGVASNATKSAKDDDYTMPTTLRAFVNAGQLSGRSGQATLFADGTLDVGGTAGDDNIRVSRNHDGDVRVAIDGRTRTVDRTRVTGLVVHVGAGEDRVRVDINGLSDLNGSVVIQGGRGNDRIDYGGSEYGYDGTVLIDGGDGNDRIAGGAGNDTLYGGDGDDTLTGGVGIDRLFGEPGDDVLVANDASGADDFVVNTLAGGPGADRLARSRHADGRRDILDRDDLDTIV